MNELLETLLDAKGSIKFEKLKHGDRVIGYTCIFPLQDGTDRAIGMESESLEGLLDLMKSYAI